MYERKAGSSSRRIAVTGRSDQYVYFASQQAMKASACAVFSAARRCAAARSESRCERIRPRAIAFQCPGGVMVPAPSAQKSAIRFCLVVRACETS
jgi:hypothetical protein